MQRDKKRKEKKGMGAGNRACNKAFIVRLMGTHQMRCGEKERRAQVGSNYLISLLSTTVGD
jgi:hypothetical protein